MPYSDAQANRVYQRRWVARRRAKWFADKQCERCGSSSRLELHHRDPTQKVAHAIWTWSARRRDAEIAKCEIVCRPCHRDEHRPHLREIASARRRDGSGRFVREYA